MHEVGIRTLSTGRLDLFDISDLLRSCVTFSSRLASAAGFILGLEIYSSIAALLKAEGGKTLSLPNYHSRVHKSLVLKPYPEMQV